MNVRKYHTKKSRKAAGTPRKKS